MLRVTQWHPDDQQGRGGKNYWDWRGFSYSKLSPVTGYVGIPVLGIAAFIGLAALLSG